MNQTYEKDYWEKRSNYKSSFLKGKKPFLHKYIMSILKKINKQGNLLDVGCGKGFFLEYAERMYETYGVDISKFAIRRAKLRCKKTKFKIGSATSLNKIYDNNSFDIVTCFDVIEHLQKPEQLINNVKKVLKIGGVFLLSTPNLNSFGKKIKKENWHGYRDKTHISLMHFKQMKKMLENSNFKVLNIFYDGLWDSPYFKYIPKFLQHIIFKIPSTVLLKYIKNFECCGENIYIICCKK